MLVVGVAADALAAADTVTPAAADADVVAAAAASESLSICAGDGAVDAGELAAIAAAAIASGAVALPDGGVVGGISVETMVTAIATATGFGVVTDVATCCDKSAATVEESGAEAVSEGTFRSVDFFSIGFAVPAFKVLGLAPDC